MTPAIMDLQTLYLIPARLLIIGLGLVAAYLIACGVNALIELFSELQGRRQRTRKERMHVCENGTTPAMPAPGSGLQRSRGSRRPFHAPPLPGA